MEKQPQDTFDVTVDDSKQVSTEKEDTSEEYNTYGMNALFYDVAYHIDKYQVRRFNDGEPYTITIKALSRDHANIDDCIGRLLWKGEILLGNLLLHLPVKGLDVLELGAGVGYAAFCCRGARTITISDYLDDIIEVEKDNIHLNEALFQGQTAVEAVKLDWFADGAINLKTVRGKKQILFGSELFYDKELIRPLFSTINELMDNDGVCYLLNFVFRYINCEKEILECLNSFHFFWEKQLLNYGDATSSYYLFVIRKQFSDVTSLDPSTLLM